MQSEQIRPSTHEEYARTLRLYAYPRFGAKPATEVTRADVRDLVVAISAQGKSRSVARNLLAPVQQTFNQLIDDGLMTANPAARMGRYLKDKKDRRAGLELLTPEEEEVLLTAALTHASRYYCLLLCTLRTGLRIGELFGLQWDDLDFSGRFIEVRRTLKDGRRVFAPKNGKIRRVDMSRQLCDELKRHRAQHSQEALAKGLGRLPWVFIDSQGQPSVQEQLWQESISEASQKGRGAADQVPRSTTHVRLTASSERRVARLCERPTWPCLDQDHR